MIKCDGCKKSGDEVERICPTFLDCFFGAKDLCTDCQVRFNDAFKAACMRLQNSLDEFVEKWGSGSS